MSNQIRKLETEIHWSPAAELGAARRYGVNFCLLNKNRISIRRDEDLRFNRVRIRKVLLPLLKDFNPKIVETLAQMARLLREDSERLTVENRRRKKEN